MEETTSYETEQKTEREDVIANVNPELEQTENAGKDEVLGCEAPQKEAIENIPPADVQEIVAKPRKTKKLSRRKRKKLAKRERMLDLTKDIRYRGFLSYRGLRIIAWILIILSQVGVLFTLYGKVAPEFAEKIGSWDTVLTALRNYMTPLFLMAAFATILNNSRKFRSLLILYGGFSIVFYALFCLLHDRYLVGLFMKAADVSREEALVMVDNFINMLLKNGYFSFNIFIDLFICSLFTYFVVYQPKKVFVGKKLIIFRLFAIFPVAYEIASFVIKVLSSFKTITMSSYLFPLLTTKPPMTFLIFVFLTFFIKNRERLFRRNGKTHEDYQKFLGTNLNSLQFSSFVATQFVVVAIIDLILAIVLSAALSGHFSEAENAFEASLAAVSSWGIGMCTPLILVAPLLLLFSYTRSYKDTRPDLIINILGIIALVLVYLEGFYQLAIRGLDLVQGLIDGFLGGMGADMLGTL